ncbi:MAG: CPBP family intramembrane metalloprotease [Treponema sp.]|jgi:membrane protease YdiL (CAAX protease family)|nr:CPBP family intramembrane metalloprotease [Treponema sp.]
MITVDLWKRNNFRMKDAVLLCLFLTGTRFLVDLALLLTGVNLVLLYDIAFLGIVIAMIMRSGRGELGKILRWRTVPVPLFCSLVVMFFGMEVMRRELGNVMEIILPVPEGFFGGTYSGNVAMVIISSAVFPAFTEELFFRGMLLNRLRRRYSARRALVASSLLFGLMHLNPWQALLASVSGLFYGWIYMKFGTIWLCMFMHCYNNILAFFMPFPVNYLPNTRDYSPLVLQPLWFDILGAVLFAAGLALTAGQRGKSGTG